MKKKLIALVCALALAVGLVGCSLSTPDSVGTIGEVDIPSGLYLLAQFDAYQTAADLASDDQDATKVSSFLKATITVDDATGETAVVSDYVAQKTLETLQTLAAVDARFTELGGELTEEQKSAADSYAQQLIEKFDVRSGQGPITVVRSMSGGNQQKAIIARELDRDKPLIVAVQPTRGLDVGAIEYIHSQLVAERDRGKAVLLVSLELDEVMSLSDRILVMYEGEIVGQLDPKKTSVSELGLYMSGAKRDNKGGDEA